MKLIMQDDARLKFVRPIVVISSGVVFARARQKLVSDARMKVLAVHAYRCQWISVMDGCTPCFEIAVSDIRKKAACPTKQQKPRYPAAAVSAEHVASPANADGADAHAENDKARWFVSTGAVFLFIDIV